MTVEKQISISMLDSKQIITNNNPEKNSETFFDKICKIKWKNVIALTTLHALVVAGFVHCLNHDVKFHTVFYTVMLSIFSGLGNTVGAHRLWAHRSFKARLPLRLLLAFLQTMTMNGSCYSFARDHRTHHKYSDTDGDPKNPNRGLFFSHMGWWLVKKNQTVIEHGQKLDFTDLKEDKVCWYQHKFYTLLYILLGIVLPWLIPVYGWNEDMLTAFYICVPIRTAIILHHYFCVNSITHFFGYRPYDFRMRPAENRLVIYLSAGEGNHNYHHVFPYDYATCEKKFWESFNPGTMMIDLFNMTGLAYDCKKASPAVIAGTIERIGVPAYFDPPRSLCFRIVTGILDWIAGILVDLWFIYPIFLYKWINGLPLFIF